MSVEQVQYFLEHEQHEKLSLDQVHNLVSPPPSLFVESVKDVH